MSANKKRMSKKTIITRIICGILAFLMVGSIIYSAAAVLFF